MSPPTRLDTQPPASRTGPSAARDEPPCDTRQGLIRVRVRAFTQLFNSLDPSPFLERDLDDDMVDYITSWAREIPRDRPLRLVIELSEPPLALDDEAVLGAAVHNHFANASELKRNELRELLRRGRVSLAIGLAVLSAATLASHYVGALGHEPLYGVLRESLIIGGWVAMWRPLELLLYDWWPLRHDGRNLERLRDAEVRIAVRGA